MSVLPPLHLRHAAFERRARGLRALGVLSEADLLVVDAVAERFGERCPEVLLGLALAVRAPRAGHVGVDLLQVARQVDDELSRWRLPQQAAPEQLGETWPQDPSAWQQAVCSSPMVGGLQDSQTPFATQSLADGSTLVMSRRQWREQARLAMALTNLVRSAAEPALDGEQLRAGLARLFRDPTQAAAVAVRTAATSRLTVVTGGPGTGKTFSIKRLLALLLELPRAPGAGPLQVALAAPTGKAAVRMAEAMAEGLAELPVSEQVRSLLTQAEPSTLHKLLGVRPDGSCRHGLANPVPADVVVVDEASMVDLALMRHLAEAIPPGARLVLLGDRDQLASVEAGTVLADLVSGAFEPLAAEAAEPSEDPERPLAASVVAFTHSHRFAQAPTVAHVAAALQRGDEANLADACALLTGARRLDEDPLPDRVIHLGAARDGWPTEPQLAALAAPYLAQPGARRLLEAGGGARLDPGCGYAGLLAAALKRWGTRAPQLRAPWLHRLLLDALDGHRVLAVHRRGPLGVSGLLRALRRHVEAGLVNALCERRGLPPQSTSLPARGAHWLGRPVLITENAYDVGLFNGDIGLVLPTEAGLAAIFPALDDEGSPGTRAVALARLPPHTGALAMTVHKSQGSQFRRVGLVLAGRDSPIQTRELIYTGITRSSARLDWLGDPGELERALARRVARASGLKELLWPTQ